MVIARNHCGWCIALPSKGIVQLDLGMVVIMMGGDEFVALIKLLDALKDQSRVSWYDVTGDSKYSRWLGFCPQHKLYSFQFDRMLLRLRPPLFEAFRALCASGNAYLQAQASTGSPHPITCPSGMNAALN
jgi:hypothetical protein